MENRLKELRTEKGWRQKDVAEKLNVSAQVYSNYENGINKPDPDMLAAMADLFDVTVDYLIGRDFLSDRLDVYDAVTLHDIRNGTKQAGVARSRERALLTAFSQLDEKNKDLALQTIQLWASLTKK